MKKYISDFILIISIIVFIACGIKIFMIYRPYVEGNNVYEEVEKEAIIDKDVGETPKDESEEYKRTFYVDFDKLYETNKDTVAWIRFDEPASISYPVVKSKDNKEYLKKTFKANDNKLGAIFMDKDNIGDFSDKNTIIYGHNVRIGDLMFAPIKKYSDESFYNSYPYFYIYTPDGAEHIYKIFAAGIVKDTAINYYKYFPTDDDYLYFLNSCINSSNYNTNSDLSVNDKIVTLSTCTSVKPDERFVVQGYLYKTNK